MPITGINNVPSTATKESNPVSFSNTLPAATPILVNNCTIGVAPTIIAANSLPATGAHAWMSWPIRAKPSLIAVNVAVSPACTEGSEENALNCAAKLLNPFRKEPPLGADLAMLLMAEITSAVALTNCPKAAPPSCAHLLIVPFFARRSDEAAVRENHPASDVSHCTTTGAAPAANAMKMRTIDPRLEPRGFTPAAIVCMAVLKLRKKVVCVST